MSASLLAGEVLLSVAVVFFGLITSCSESSSSESGITAFVGVVLSGWFFGCVLVLVAVWGMLVDNRKV